MKLISISSFISIIELIRSAAEESREKFRFPSKPTVAADRSMFQGGSRPRPAAVGRSRLEAAQLTALAGLSVH